MAGVCVCVCVCVCVFTLQKEKPTRDLIEISTQAYTQKASTVRQLWDIELL